VPSEGSIVCASFGFVDLAYRIPVIRHKQMRPGPVATDRWDLRITDPRLEM
jgi:hypothetical protein